MEYAVLSMVLCTIMNPWSHSKRVGHCPDFGLPSVAILPWLCRKRRKAVFPHSWPYRWIVLPPKAFNQLVSADQSTVIFWQMEYRIHGIVQQSQQTASEKLIHAALKPLDDCSCRLSQVVYYSTSILFTTVAIAMCLVRIDFRFRYYF